jgi:hypothetical protein
VTVTPDSTLDDDTLGFDEFRLDVYFTGPNVIGGS